MDATIDALRAAPSAAAASAAATALVSAQPAVAAQALVTLTRPAAGGAAGAAGAAAGAAAAAPPPVTPEAERLWRSEAGCSLLAPSRGKFELTLTAAELRGSKTTAAGAEFFAVPLACIEQIVRVRDYGRAKPTTALVVRASQKITVTKPAGVSATSCFFRANCEEQKSKDVDALVAALQKATGKGVTVPEDSVFKSCKRMSNVPKASSNAIVRDTVEGELFPLRGCMLFLCNSAKDMALLPVVDVTEFAFDRAASGRTFGLTLSANGQTCSFVNLCIDDEPRMQSYTKEQIERPRHAAAKAAANTEAATAAAAAAGADGAGAGAQPADDDGDSDSEEDAYDPENDDDEAAEANADDRWQEDGSGSDSGDSGSESGSGSGPGSDDEQDGAGATEKGAGESAGGKAAAAPVPAAAAASGGAVAACEPKREAGPAAVADSTNAQKKQRTMDSFFAR